MHKLYKTIILIGLVAQLSCNNNSVINWLVGFILVTLCYYGFEKKGEGHLQEVHLIEKIWYVRNCQCTISGYLLSLWNKILFIYGLSGHSSLILLSLYSHILTFGVVRSLNSYRHLKVSWIEVVKLCLQLWCNIASYRSAVQWNIMKVWHTNQRKVETYKN